jgi:hypothetical protein
VKTNKTRDTGNSRLKSVPCFVCRHSLSLAYYCQCSLFCLSSLCILILLLPVFLAKQGTLAIVGSRYRVKTNKTRNTGNSRLKIVPCFVCLHSVSWAYYCQCTLFCLSLLYLESTIAGVPCFVCRYSLSLAYYCQCSLFCRQTKQVTLAIVGSRYRVKTNKTRDTGNSRIKIQSEDKCTLFCLSLLYLESTIAGVPCFVCLHSVSWAY